MFDIQHEPIQTLEKIETWPMGSTTNLSKYSKEMDSYVEAKVLVSPKDTKVHPSETPQLDTPSR